MWERSDLYVLENLYKYRPSSLADPMKKTFTTHINMGPMYGQTKHIIIMIHTLIASLFFFLAGNEFGIKRKTQGFVFW